MWGAFTPWWPGVGDYARVESTTERDTLFSAPYYGDLCYVRAIDELQIYGQSGAWEFLCKSPSNAWTDWSPGFAQAGVRSTTVNRARYWKFGRVCFVECAITAAAGGAAGNAVLVYSFPFAPAGTNQVLGQAMCGLAGAEYHGTALFNGTNAEVVFSISSYANKLGVTPGGALAIGDKCWFKGFYETTT